MWLILVFLFISNNNIRGNLAILFTAFLSLILWYVIKGIISYPNPSYHVKYIILCRAIAVTQEKTKFIKKIEEWEEKENFCPTDKGIDPYDVLRSLEEACDFGLKSLEEEKKKYGYISQL